MRPVQIITMYVVLLTPIVALASVGTYLAAETGGVIGAFAGAFAGNVVSRWTLLRRHETRCVHYEENGK